jgi:chromosome segregation ATPase
MVKAGPGALQSKDEFTMRSHESAEPQQSSCIKAIEEFRARLHILEQDLKNTRDELFELYKNMPQPGTPEYEERQGQIARLTRRLADLEVAHAHALPTLERMEAECREKRAQGETAPAEFERSLRKTIDDPRYWRDGDPALARFVSDGFKRLYPDESDD